MNPDRQSKSSETKQVYFAGLQRKIKVKYNEAQDKLEKSKSSDTLNKFFDDPHFINDINLVSLPKSKNECTDKSVFDFNVTKSVSLENVYDKKGLKFCDEIESCFTETSARNRSQINKVDSALVLNDEKDDDCSIEFVNLTSDCREDKDKQVASENTIIDGAQKPKLSFRSRLKLKIAKAKERRRHSKVLEKNTALCSRREANDRVDKVSLSNSSADKSPQSPTKSRKRYKIGTVTVGILEATGYERNIDGKNTIPSLHCRLKLGTEKYKTKAVKEKSDKFSWMELANLSLHDDYVLEVCLWERDILLGKTTVDCSNMEKDKTHKLELHLSDLPMVQLHTLLTVTGMVKSENEEENIETNKIAESRSHVGSIEMKKVRQKYKDLDQVGRLNVTVLGARGLPSQDCYCVIELDNQRAQTQTEHKTNDPAWMKLFNYEVHDITSILEVTVCDEKKNQEVIGKLSIPLLNIKNGERNWYALKDSHQRIHAKGQNARISLQMSVYWDIYKASLRVISPKERKYLKAHHSLDRHVLARNLARIKAVVTWILYSLVVLKTCFEWESRRDNLIALAIWLTFCWNFHGWMIPLLFILPFIWYRKEYQKLHGLIFSKENASDVLNELSDQDFTNEVHPSASNISSRSMENLENKEEKTLRQRFQSLQDMVLSIQRNIGIVASYGESIKNLYNFTVPYLSCLAIILLSAISFGVYLVPSKYIFMVWGIHKFTRKILRPNRIPNNEILDLLSRVPDDETLLDCQLLPLDPALIASDPDYA